MSREIRRVPLDYEHPTQPDVYGRFSSRKHVSNGPRILDDGMSFVPQFEGYMYQEAVNEYYEYKDPLLSRSGELWDFAVDYYLNGMIVDGVRKGPYPYAYLQRFGDRVTVRDEEHLAELMAYEHEESYPDPDRYMPTFNDVPDSQMGYCLYECVSEGTPVTPVFASKEELLEHLVAYGTLSDPPLRYESAESIVKMGNTIGSMAVVEGKVFSSTENADVFEQSR